MLKLENILTGENKYSAQMIHKTFKFLHFIANVSYIMIKFYQSFEKNMACALKDMPTYVYQFWLFAKQPFTLTLFTNKI